MPSAITIRSSWVRYRSDSAGAGPLGIDARGPASAATACPNDRSYLACLVKQHLGHTFRFVELANDVNEHMPDY